MHSNCFPFEYVGFEEFVKWGVCERSWDGRMGGNYGFLKTFQVDWKVKIIKKKW